MSITRMLTVAVIVALAAFAWFLFGDRWFAATPADPPEPVAEQPAEAVAETPAAASDAFAPAPPEPAVPPAVEEPVPMEPAAAARRPESGQTTEEPATVRGRVLDQAWQPLEGVTVSVYLSDHPFGGAVLGTYDAVTGRDGAFLVEGIDRFGTARVHPAEADWCVPTSSGGAVPAFMQNFVTLTPGSDADIGEIVLAQANAVLAGEVVTRGGRPVADASVMLTKCGGLHATQLASSARTDVAGRFAMGLPADGECAVLVQGGGEGVKAFENLAAGSGSVRLVMPGTGAIEGRVTAAGGGSAADVGVLAIPNQMGDIDSLRGTVVAMTDAGGRYRIDGLAEGRYAVVATPNASRIPEDEPLRPMLLREGVGIGSAQFGERSYVEQDVRVTAGASTPVDLTLARMARVHGTVLEEGTGRPRPGVFVRFFGRFETADGRRQHVSGLTRTDDDGQYVLEVDVPTPLRMRGLVTSVAGGSFTSLGMLGRGTEHQVAPGGDHRVDFEVPDAFQLTFRVVRRDGVPESGVRVSFVAASGGDVHVNGEMVTDGAGRAYYDGAAPDQPLRAKALLVENGQTIGAGTSVVIDPANPPDGEIPITLDILGGVSGVALRPDGTPFANLRLGIRAFLHGVELSDDAIKFHVARADENGAFEVPFAFPPGTHTVIVGEGMGDNISVAVIDGIGIAADATTDLGYITLHPVSEAEYEALVHPGR